MQQLMENKIYFQEILKDQTNNIQYQRLKQQKNRMQIMSDTLLKYSNTIKDLETKVIVLEQQNEKYYNLYLEVSQDNKQLMEKYRVTLLQVENQRDQKTKQIYLNSSLKQEIFRKQSQKEFKKLQETGKEAQLINQGLSYGKLFEKYLKTLKKLEKKENQVKILKQSSRSIGNYDQIKLSQFSENDLIKLLAKSNACNSVKKQLKKKSAFNDNKKVERQVNNSRQLKKYNFVCPCHVIGKSRSKNHKSRQHETQFDV